MLTEEWLPIPSLPGYEASSLGRIRDPKYGIRKFQTHNSGYLFFRVGKRTLNPQRLVCEAFHGLPPSPEAQVLHGPDNTKTNIKPCNLRWGSDRQNKQDWINTGNSPLARSGELHVRSALTWDDVHAIRKAHAEGEMVTEISKRYNVTKSCCYAITQGRTWKEG